MDSENNFKGLHYDNWLPPWQVQHYKYIYISQESYATGSQCTCIMYYGLTTVNQQHDAMTYLTFLSSVVP
jgi:hypothetical protein